MKRLEIYQSNGVKTRYSDLELKEFKELILQKIQNAREELRVLSQSLNQSDLNGINDTASVYQTFEDSAATLERESISQLAARQKKFIENLENALIRIENKTYGTCRESGNLIPKERLRAVPHATLSVEAKMRQA